MAPAAGMVRAWVISLIAGILFGATGKVMAQDYRNYELVKDESILRAGEQIEDKIRKNFFLRAEVSAQECFVGEPLMAVFKVYSRLNASSRVVKRPSLGGFSVMEMVDAYSNQPEVELYEGEYYFVHLIRKVQLFSLQPGNFILEPAEVESAIQFTKAGAGVSSRLRRESAHGGGQLERRMLFKTPEVTIRVKPLPEKEQPAGFSGAVGQFTLSLEMPKNSLVSGEPAQVVLQVSGTGNFPLLTDPDITWPQGIEVLEPSVSEEVNKYVFPLSGSKSFRYALPTPDTGQFIIPPVSFSYFDPAAGSYKTIVSTGLAYSVEPGLNTSAVQPVLPGNKPVQRPVHYYYWGVAVVFILCWIAYQLFRSKKKGGGIMDR